MAETTVISVRGRDRKVLLADPDFVYVGRAVPSAGWRSSPFGNPFKPDTDVRAAFRIMNEHGITGLGVFGTTIMTPDLCVQFYEKLVRNCPAMKKRLPELRGKRLGCWCGNFPEDPNLLCHGVVLAKLCNAMPGD